jgi:aspartyl-tRNA(Asn)/glutamyl-tRNA(Gln) amidotransferase subunit C
MNQREPESTLSEVAVRHVANLARLAISDDEVTKAKEDLTAIFAHIACLKIIDTENVDPLDHPTEIMNHSRVDSAGNSFTQEQVFANAPAIKGVYFDVPKVLGHSG